MNVTACSHDPVTCLNQYEFIRKYRCADCGAVMMCACDEAFGRRFLSHQLSEGVELETQARVPVTGGFQPAICNGCRELPLVAAPGAAIHGRTSKIKRFYWRELYFREKEREADWEAENPDASAEEKAEAAKRIEASVLEEIKRLHETSPLYDMREPSTAEILKRYDVKVETFHPEFAAIPEKGAVVILDGTVVSPETFVASQYEKQGWQAMRLESVPLHALFGTMMWLVIEHPGDPRSRMVAFGSRTAYEAGTERKLISLNLPEDFGTPGFGQRRKAALDEHFDSMFRMNGSDDREWLLHLFDCWRGPSERLRQYLWAHRDVDMDRSRRLIEVLSPETILAILEYLSGDYWGRYLGWPDLMLWRQEEIRLVEVKSSSDKLSAEQMRWIADNHDILKLPFRLAKLHRPSRQGTVKATA